MTDVARTSRRWPRLLILLTLSLLLHALLVDWGRQHMIALNAPQEHSITVELRPVAPPAQEVALPAPPARQPAPVRAAPKPPRALPRAPEPAIEVPDEPIRERVEPILTTAPEASRSLPAQASAGAGNGAAAGAADANTDSGSSSNASAPHDDQPVSGKHYRVAAPPSAVLDYDVTGTKDQRPAYGSGRITWVNQDGHYEALGRAKALFFTVLDFSSRGQLDDWGVSPELYTEKKGFKSATNTHFNRARNLISFSASTTSYPRQGGEQDRASLIWQLAAIGRGDASQIQPGATIDLFVAGVRDGEIWRVQVIGPESLALPIGTLQTWHLVRIPKPGSFDDRVDIWLAPQHEWYPVKVRYTDLRPEGDYIDLALSALSPGP